MANFSKAFGEFKTLASTYFNHPLMQQGKSIASQAARDGSSFGRSALLKAGGLNGIGLRAGIGAGVGAAGGAGYSYADRGRVDMGDMLRGGLLGGAVGGGYGAYRGLTGGFRGAYGAAKNFGVRAGRDLRNLGMSARNYGPMGSEGFVRTSSGPLVSNSRSAEIMKRIMSPRPLALPQLASPGNY